MRLSSIAAVVIALLACLWTLSAQTGYPKMTAVTPNVAKAGDVITATGENLDKNNVAALLLTNNNQDVKVQITEQSATEVKFAVPDSVQPGRYELVIRTSGTGDVPVMELVQPLRLTVQ